MDPSNSQPRVATWRGADIGVEESPKTNKGRWIVEATSENQHGYNKCRAAHESRLLDLPGAPSSRSRSHSRTRTPSTSPMPPSRSPLATSDVGSAVYRRRRRPRGKRDGPLMPETRFNAEVKRKLKLVCESHRESKRKCNCFDFSELERGWEALQPRLNDNQTRLSAQQDSGTQADPSPSEFPNIWPEAPDTTITPADDQTTISLDPTSISQPVRAELVILVEQYGPSRVPSNPSLPAPNPRPLFSPVNITPVVNSQTELFTENTIIVGTEHLDTSGGHFWMCMHEGCGCGTANSSPECLMRHKNIAAMDAHFLVRHKNCFQKNTMYWVRCKSCGAHSYPFSPCRLPNHGYCSCSWDRGPAQRSLWQLLATISGPMSTGMGPESLAISGVDSWDETISTTDTYTSYTSFSSNLNDFGGGPNGFGSSYGYTCPLLELECSHHLNHGDAKAHLATDCGRNKTTKLLLLFQYLKSKSQWVQGRLGAPLKALPQYISHKYNPTSHGLQYQISGPDSLPRQVVTDIASRGFPRSIASCASHLIRCLWLAVTIVIILAPLLLGFFLELRAKREFVPARSPHILPC